jgi:hypothetical protein
MRADGAGVDLLGQNRRARSVTSGSLRLKRVDNDGLGLVGAFH